MRERKDGRNEGGANREMGAGSKMEKGRKTEKQREEGRLRREFRKRVRGSGKGRMRREGRLEGRTPGRPWRREWLGLGRRAWWGMKKGAVRGRSIEIRCPGSQERGEGRNEVGKQRVKVRSVGRED